MVWFADTLWCDGCGVEISWNPIEASEQVYCCRKCFQGERCQCAEISEDYPSKFEKRDQNITQIDH